MSVRVQEVSKVFTPRASTCLYAAVNFIIGIMLATYTLYDAHQHWENGVDWAGMAIYLAGMTVCVIELVRTHDHWGTALANVARRIGKSTNGNAGGSTS